MRIAFFSQSFPLCKHPTLGGYTKRVCFHWCFCFLENCSRVRPAGFCCARVRSRCCTHSAAAAVDSSASPGRADRSRDRNNRCRRMCARRRGGVPHRAPPPPHRCTPYIVPTVLDRVYRVILLTVVIRFVRYSFPPHTCLRWTAKNRHSSPQLGEYYLTWRCFPRAVVV